MLPACSVAFTLPINQSVCLSIYLSGYESFDPVYLCSCLSIHHPSIYIPYLSICVAVDVQSYAVAYVQTYNAIQYNAIQYNTYTTRIHTCMHTCTHAYMNTCVHTYLPTYLPTDRPAYLPTCILAYRCNTNFCRYACMQVCMYVCVCTYVCMYVCMYVVLFVLLAWLFVRVFSVFVFSYVCVHVR